MNRIKCTLFTLLILSSIVIEQAAYAQKPNYVNRLRKGIAYFVMSKPCTAQDKKAVYQTIGAIAVLAIAAPSTLFIYQKWRNIRENIFSFKYSDKKRELQQLSEKRSQLENEVKELRKAIPYEWEDYIHNSINDKLQDACATGDIATTRKTLNIAKKMGIPWSNNLEVHLIKTIHFLMQFHDSGGYWNTKPPIENVRLIIQEIAQEIKRTQGFLSQKAQQDINDLNKNIPKQHVGYQNYANEKQTVITILKNATLDITIN